MAGTYVYDVTEEDFEQKVIEASKKQPVIVDFWAPWCGPCQVLGPTLEKLADEMAGGFVIAKVNTDEAQALAGAFQIQSIPTVHLFVDGRPVDGFMGALGESELRDFLKPHVKAGPPDGGDEAEAEAGADPETLLSQGRHDEARAQLLERVAADAEDMQAHFLLARIAFDEDDAEAVQRHVAAIPEEATEARAAASLANGLRFRADCGGDPQAARQKVEADPEDLDARYAFGCCLAVDGRYESALEQFMEVVKRDKNHREGAAHKAMLTIFGLLEAGSDVTRTYRRQLTLFL